MKTVGATMRNLFLSAATILGLSAGSLSAADVPLIGIVNFSTCISNSKVGKKEQENMESIRKQMSSLVEETEKELREISAKFEDTEYLDSLSPKAEEDLKNRFQALQEDLGRYQNKFYQVLQHANYQMIQKVSQSISKASEKIAKQRKLDYVINKEACFYMSPDLDMTNLVVSEMDQSFDLESKKLSENEEVPQPQAIYETMLNQAG